MEVIAVKFFPIPIDPGSNEEKYDFHSYISCDNGLDACDSHAHVFHLFKIYFNL